MPSSTSCPSIGGVCFDQLERKVTTDQKLPARDELHFWMFVSLGFLDVESWILDRGFFMIFVDLGFGILIPSTTKGLEPLVLSTFL